MQRAFLCAALVLFVAGCVGPPYVASPVPADFPKGYVLSAETLPPGAVFQYGGNPPDHPEATVVGAAGGMWPQEILFPGVPWPAGTEGAARGLPMSSIQVIAYSMPTSERAAHMVQSIATGSRTASSPGNYFYRGIPESTCENPAAEEVLVAGSRTFVIVTGASPQVENAVATLLTKNPSLVDAHICS